MNAERWPSLARDLAILATPDAPFTLDVIKREYGIDDEELKALTKSSAFLALFDREVELVAKAGDKAGSRYRAMALSGALAEKLFKDAVADKVEPKESMKLLELLYRASGVMEPERPTAIAAIQNSVGVGVRLPLPNIPKLKHAVAAPVDEGEKTE